MRTRRVLQTVLVVVTLVIMAGLGLAQESELVHTPPPAQDTDIDDSLQGASKPPGLLKEGWEWVQYVGEKGLDAYSVERRPAKDDPWETMMALNALGELMIKGEALGLGGSFATRLTSQGSTELFAVVNGMQTLGLWSDGVSSRAQVFGDLDITGLLNGGTPWTSANDGVGSGLDADLIDGLDSSALATAGHNHDVAYVNDDAGEVGDADVAAGALSPDRINGTAWTGSNDGAGSGLDADMVDGLDSSAFAGVLHNHDTAYVNDDAGEVGDTDVPVGALSADRINGTAWTGSNDGDSSGLDADLIDGFDSSEFAGVVHNHDAAYWKLTGNAGTTPGLNFLGTTDNVALTVAVNGTAALRLFPDSTSPNVVAGNSSNSVYGATRGASIGGGGLSGAANQVRGNFGTVGGGSQNLAGGSYTSAGNDHATVSGGQDNQASQSHTTVGGGKGNRASTDYATVGGGLDNDATAHSATVAGGHANLASNSSSTVAGGSTAFIGTPTVITLGEDIVGWDISVLADNTNAALVVKGVGSGYETIRWVATVRTVEVAF